MTSLKKALKNFKKVFFSALWINYKLFALALRCHSFSWWLFVRTPDSEDVRWFRLRLHRSGNRRGRQTTSLLMISKAHLFVIEVSISLFYYHVGTLLSIASYHASSPNVIIGRRTDRYIGIFNLRVILSLSKHRLLTSQALGLCAVTNCDSQLAQRLLEAFSH